jgi:serine/threonine protein kinase
MTSNKEVIGQGVYGCIHKPSIRCEENPEIGFDYNNYVSKFMLKTDAMKEFNEFLIIDRIDTNNDYHLGNPIMCKPNLIFPTEKNAIKKCRRFNFNDIQQNPNNYSLILLKYGGHDLKDFCSKYLRDYLQQTNKYYKEYNSDIFWFSLKTLFEGINLFHNNNISHNDIKPQNILFNQTTIEFKYIDFGLMDSYDNIKLDSINNNNKLGVFHWSYPLETGFMNYDNFVSYKEKSQSNKQIFQNKLTNSIINGEEINEIENPEQFKTLFDFLFISPNKKQVEHQINAFFDGLNEFVSMNSYEECINMIIRSIDIFGLGFTVQYIANCFLKLNEIDMKFYDDLSKLTEKMCQFNILKRELNIHLLVDNYLELLNDSGILDRLNSINVKGGTIRKTKNKRKNKKKKLTNRKIFYKRRNK